MKTEKRLVTQNIKQLGFSGLQYFSALFNFFPTVDRNQARKPNRYKHFEKTHNFTKRNNMKKIATLILTIGLNINLFSQPKIIFDTDFGGDADDLGALVMLHHFIDKNECDLLAIMSWSLEKYTVSAIDAVNRFYGHPSIPIGTRKGDTYYADWNYNKPLADSFPFQLTYNDVPDATYLYRKILSENADTSLIIVTVGPLENIKKLIESQADSLSELNGKEIINKKVKKFVIMGGAIPGRK
jgi:hypothetical protein